MEMELFAIAAAVGYLCGSISNGRMIARIFAPGADISRIKYDIPDTDLVFTSDSVSGTAVRMHVGARFGALTALLDMLKVAIPTLAFKIWKPDAPYFLVVAAFGLVGHDWPLYHRFQGGRGESPIYGALIVIDWFGVLVTNVLGWLIGFVARNILVLRWAAMILWIPWFWFTTRDWAYVGYVVFANLVYWYTMYPELKQYPELRKAGLDASQEELAEFLGMGTSLGRFLDTYSWRGFLRRLIGRRSSREG